MTRIPPISSRKAFEAYMRKNRIEPSAWFGCWPFWKAGVAWQRKLSGKRRRP
jgi:hypothetical protein